MLSFVVSMSVGVCAWGSAWGSAIDPPAQSVIKEDPQIGADAIAQFAALGVSVSPSGELLAGVINVGQRRELWVLGNGEWILALGTDDGGDGEVLAFGAVWSGVEDERTLLLRLTGAMLTIDGRLFPDHKGDHEGGRLHFDGRIGWGKVERMASYARFVRGGAGGADAAEPGALLCLCVCADGRISRVGCAVQECDVGAPCDPGFDCSVPAETIEPPGKGGDGPGGGGGGGGGGRETIAAAPPVAAPRTGKCTLVDPNGSWLAGVGFLMAAGWAGGVVVRRRARR